MNVFKLASLSGLLVLAACDGFREAMTAHVDVAARAGGQELSVDRLASMLEQAKVPPTPEVSRGVTDLWVNYQLLAKAAAENDSLKDSTRIDEALWPILAQMRASKWHQQIAAKRGGGDTTISEARYNQGDVFAAQHILFMVPQGLTPAGVDSIRRRAQQVRGQVTPANFAQLASQHSQDPQSGPRGGQLGIFPRGAMVPEFEQALVALQPGQISPLVQTQFGFHIIRRQPLSEVRDEYAQAMRAMTSRTADSAYVADLQKAGDIKFRSNAVQTLRNVSKDFAAHRDDKTVIATSKAGDFTVARLVRWLDGFPDQNSIRQGFQTAPDSAVLNFTKQLVTNELVIRQADSAKVQVDAQELTGLRDRFKQMVAGTWETLGITPKSLADSATNENERQRVAAGRVERYIDQLFLNQVRFVDVPQPLQEVLRNKYDWKIYSSGIERAMQRAAKERAKQDSVRAANQPPSQVPLQSPGQPATPAPQGTTPATPAPEQKAPTTP
ncbi:MAG TPA: peptidylprolyl isomerase [Gemmatimonadaceae bacterium]|nr:peptidylprolyl isomerase [Gemmatimonadaceae bacterium]